MNTIIVATDFSPLADEAMQYGAQLATALHAPLLLVNVYAVPVMTNEIPMMMISGEELRSISEEGLARCQQSLQALFPQLSISKESRLGDVVYELEDICKEQQPFAVVIGRQNLYGVNQILSENESIPIIRNLKVPVISVRSGTTFNVPKNVALATDLLNTNKFPAERIMHFIKQLAATLHIVHVTEDEATAETAATLKAVSEKLNLPDSNYHLIKDEDIAHGLQHYMEQQAVDLLMLIPHEHSLLEKWFFKLHVKGILHDTALPIVSIAE